jgi:predicted O-methyltransferase YrrM
MDIDRAIRAGRLWGTKDLRFWGGLISVLNSLNPRSILEIGAGRSTSFFADHAYSTGASFISIEENWEWHLKISDDLMCMCLPHTYVHHVPIKNGWYDSTIFSDITSNRKYDMVMIDGPSGDNARGDLNGISKILDVCADAALIIVDDTHRPGAKQCLDLLAKGKHVYTSHYMQRQYRGRPDLINSIRNEVAFICSDDAAAIIATSLQTAGVI